MRQRQGRVGKRRGALGSREFADDQVRLSPQDAASDTASLKILDAARNIGQRAFRGEA